MTMVTAGSDSSGSPTCLTGMWTFSHGVCIWQTSLPARTANSSVEVSTANRRLRIEALLKLLQKMPYLSLNASNTTVTVTAHPQAWALPFCASQRCSRVANSPQSLAVITSVKRNTKYSTFPFCVEGGCFIFCLGPCRPVCSDQSLQQVSQPVIDPVCAPGSTPVRHIRVPDVGGSSQCHC